MALDATVGGPNANSYATVAEANTYFLDRMPLVPAWEDSENQEGALIMATRVLDAFVQPLRIYMPAGPTGGSRPYYIIRRQWTGLPASATQRLAWPRTGMLDRNGNVILSTVLPRELKEATCELAGQLHLNDPMLDSDAQIQGITSVKAGSVSISFKDMVETRVLPSGVLMLMPQSWFTDETYEAVNKLSFDVVS